MIVNKKLRSTNLCRNPTNVNHEYICNEGPFSTFKHVRHLLKLGNTLAWVQTTAFGSGREKADIEGFTRRFQPSPSTPGRQPVAEINISTTRSTFDSTAHCDGAGV